ncbi:unnamed protein product [Tilletia laevis]|nr:unnamed protein product [Tilletia laevis]
MLPLFALVNLLSALGALSAATPSRRKISCNSYASLDANLYTPSRNGSSLTFDYKRITLDDGTKASAMARLPHNETGYAHIKGHKASITRAACNTAETFCKRGLWMTSTVSWCSPLFLALGDYFSPASTFNPKCGGLLFTNTTGGNYGTENDCRHKTLRQHSSEGEYQVLTTMFT